MLDALSDKLTRVFKTLHGEGHLTPYKVEQGLKEIRLILLQGDVHYGVVRDFLERVKEKALDQTVLQSLTPAQQIVKIVRDEMVNLLGEPHRLPLKKSFTSIALVGLQGSGKTTTTIKLAHHLKTKRGKRILVVPADLRRPAAREQLLTLAKQADIPAFEEKAESLPHLVRAVRKHAQTFHYDGVIYDTQGRLHVDEALMKELRIGIQEMEADEVLLVVDAMTGQDAVRSAKSFHEALNLSGCIMTKLDGDTRGGALLSIRSVTGVPIAFLGVGEKVKDLEPFDPQRMARRILGLGDTLTLIEKAEQVVEEAEREEWEKKLRKKEFTLEDLKKQLRMVQKMGGLTSLLQALPKGGPWGKLQSMDVDEKALIRVEAIINSMTKEERRRPEILNASRKRRIAAGSGTTVQDINRLIKQYRQMKDMMKRMGKFKGVF